MRITISKSAKQNSLTILVLLLFCTGLYILISKTDYPWQWYRVWEHITVYDEGQWWAGALLFGLEQTIYIVILSIIGATTIGIVLASASLSKGKLAQSASKLYTVLFRNTPILVQIYCMYFLISPMFNMDRFVTGVLVLSLYESAFIGEIIRGSILSVSKTQWDAGRALRLSQPVIVYKIIMPQALRLMIAPLTNVSINLLKHSSIVSVIAVFDLTTAGRDIISETYIAMEIWITVAVFYWLISASFSYVGRRIESHIKWSA